VVAIHLPISGTTTRRIGANPSVSVGHPFAEVVAISHAARAGKVGPARFDGDAFTHPTRRNVATDRLDHTGCLVTEHEGLLQNVAADPPVLEVVHV
jgi:hypothetical protein